MVGWLIFPVLAAQASEFWRHVPEYLGRIQGVIEAIRGWAGARGLPQDAPSPGAGGTMLQALVRRTLEVTAGVLGAAFGGLVVLFLAAYIVIDARRRGEGLLVLLPADHRDRVAAMGRPVLDRMGGYVRGQMAVAVCVSIILSVGLGLLGVQFGLFIGMLAGALHLIPFVGTWIAAGVALLVAVNQSLPLALWTALLFWAEQLVEGKLLVPLLLGRNVGLHPLAVLLALLAGAKLAGLVGALAAIPIVAGGAEILRRPTSPNRSCLPAGQAIARSGKEVHFGSGLTGGAQAGTLRVGLSA